MYIWDLFSGAPFSLPANLVPLSIEMTNESLGNMPTFASAALPDDPWFVPAGTDKGISSLKAFLGIKHKHPTKKEQADLLKKALDSIMDVNKEVEAIKAVESMDELESFLDSADFLGE